MENTRSMGRRGRPGPCAGVSAHHRQFTAKAVHPAPVLRDSHCRRAGQWRFRQECAHIRLNHLEPIRIFHQVRFCQHDQSSLDSQKRQDGQMLARLRHDALIGGDDQQHGVHPAHAGKHVLDEVTMPGDVDDPDDRRLASSRRSRRSIVIDVRVPQAVGVHPGQA
jgi:hypothetical protein